MDVLYCDKSIIVGVKPCGVLSTDEEGGMPSLMRSYLGDSDACVLTVHRLDRVVGGLMVLARSPESASELSRQLRGDSFEKTYLAVIRGCPEQKQGRFTDLLLRSKSERKTYVVSERGKDVQEAILDYRVIAQHGFFSLAEIRLVTGRTHQIRCQFSSRGIPIIGDRKYSTDEYPCDIALWSYELGFVNPETGRRMHFRQMPPKSFPWSVFYEKNIRF